MKSLIVAFASLLFSAHLEAEIIQRPELTDSFSDQVKSLSDEGTTLIVRFHRHAAIYKIAKEHPQFKEIKQKLEKAEKALQKVTVVAIIPSMTIKEVKATP